MVAAYHEVAAILVLHNHTIVLVLRLSLTLRMTLDDNADELIARVLALEDVVHGLGVDIDNLYISQPDTGEQALEICEALVRSGAVDCVVIDSVAALTPKAEIDGEMGDSFVGIQARLMSQALRKLTAIVNKTNACVIFINQLREKIGVMYGNPETTTGGKALKFYSSIRMDIRKVDVLKDGAEIIGNRTKVKIVFQSVKWLVLVVFSYFRP